MSSAPSPPPEQQVRKKPPILKIAGLHGGLAANLWHNTIETANGQVVDAYSITIDMPRYRDPQTNEWKPSKFLRPSDAINLVFALQKVLDFCFRAESGPAQANDDSEPPPF